MEEKQLYRYPGTDPNPDRSALESVAFSVVCRTANCNFNTVDNLTNLKGIGDKIIEKIIPEITTRY